MLTLRRALKTRLALLVVGVTLAAVAVGFLRGMWASPGDDPFGNLPGLTEGEAQAQDPIVAERGLAQVKPPDPALQFPPVLRDLSASPYDLAIDPSGMLWFVLFDGQGDTNTLYRYDPASGRLEAFTVPRSNGSGLVSEIEVDPRGHIIWAEGELVLDFDPVAGAYKEIKLGPSKSVVPFIAPAGTYMTAMGLDGKGHVYVSRMNVAAVSEIDLDSGNVREMPYPESFGPVHDLAVVDGVVWITNPYDMQGGPPAQAGRIDLQTGSYEAIEGAPAIFAEAPGGKLYGTTFAQGGLAEVVGRGLSAAAPAGSALAGLGVPAGDVVAVDQRSGVVWAANEVIKGVVRFDPGLGDTRTFPLGSYLTRGVLCPAPPLDQPDLCDEPVEVTPGVQGLAVAPNGDLYFSDATFSRIGVIRADR